MNPTNNTDWNTPPNGDFARYVEVLTARAAQAARGAHGAGHDLDVGMPSAPGEQAGASTAAQQRRSAGNAPAGAKPAGNFDPVVLKLLGAVGALVFLVLWSAGVPLVVLIPLAGVALWAAQKLKGFNLKPGIAKWQQALEDAARKQKEIQRKQGK